MRLQGKVAIVTGAAGKDNMAQVIARRFAAEGASVFVTGRQEEPLKTFAEELNGGYALMDVTSREQVFAAVAAAKAKFGKVDIGVSATGWGLVKSFEDNTEEDLDRMLAIQFKGPFFFFQALLGAIDEGGSIIQISSATAKIMLDQHSAYMGTKAGIDHVVRTVANEFGHRGIRANSISPGLTRTPMAGAAFEVPGFIEAFEREYPLGRVGTTEDIAAAAVWVASDECFMTGENLQVNGGLTLRRNPSLIELGAIGAEATAHLNS
jgi:NAD(P)-dependent dehydrogenase (short-subunit alcohol dehydrogenase family)